MKYKPTIKKLIAYFLKLEKNNISTLGRIEKELFIKFKHYDLAIHMVDMSKTW